MPALNYTNLIAQIESYAEDSDTEFTGEIPSFVERAELRLTRDVDTFGTVAYSSITFVTITPSVSTPSGHLLTKSLSFTDGGQRYQLLPQTNEWVNAYWPDRTSAGRPKYYAPYGRNVILVAPAPASTNSAEWEYVVRPAALSAGVSTNYFTDFCFNALFYACMCEASVFLKDFNSAGQFEVLYQRELQILNNEGRRQRRDDQRVPLNPDGGENTKTGDK